MVNLGCVCVCAEGQCSGVAPPPSEPQFITPRGIYTDALRPSHSFYSRKFLTPRRDGKCLPLLRQLSYLLPERRARWRSLLTRASGKPNEVGGVKRVSSLTSEEQRLQESWRGNDRKRVRTSQVLGGEPCASVRGGGV